MSVLLGIMFKTLVKSSPLKAGAGLGLLIPNASPLTLHSRCFSPKGCITTTEEAACLNCDQRLSYVIVLKGRRVKVLGFWRGDSWC